MTMLFGAPAGWLLDVWLALPSHLDAFAVGAACAFLSRLVIDVYHWRRRARWPDGKP
jgi:hypothetical protein